MHLSLKKQPRKSALVLAGGGLAGVVYELGALRAIDDLLIDRTVNDFDIYVGTSAGAIVCAGLAQGIDPVTILQSIDGTHPEIRTIRSRDILSLNKRELFSRSIRVPEVIWNAIKHYWENPKDMTIFDTLWTALAGFPSALYDTMSLERYLREMFDDLGYSNRFDELCRELYIVATELDTGKRVVFGTEDEPDVPISLAVAASSAVPLLYKPVRIGERDLVDGALRGNASLDIAIENGAELIVCINPMVPITEPAKAEFLSERGMQAVFNQMLNIMLRSGLTYHIKNLRRRHPDVDIILIEPRSDELQMIHGNIMRYSSRVAVARYGYESVTLDLSADYQAYKETLARHDFAISASNVIPELERIHNADYADDIVHDVIVPGLKTKRPRHRALATLDRALDELEQELELEY